jgi:hypothetical protein
MSLSLEIFITILGTLAFSVAFVAISLAVVFQSVVLLGIVPPDSSDQQRAQYAANWSWFVSAVGTLTYVLCAILASNDSRPRSPPRPSEENLEETENAYLPTRRNALRLFGLHEGVTKKNITRAYKNLSLKAHPNKKGGSTEKFQRLQKAYTVLKKDD